jgi:hypothetical protein
MDEALRRIRRQYLSTQDPLDAESYIAALERALGVAPLLHKYEIQNMLIVSNSHIPREEADWISEREHSLPGLKFSNDYGWIFGVPATEPLDPHAIFSGDLLMLAACPHLSNLIRLARSLDCEYLRLDADGPEYKDLPTWEW